MTTEIKVEKIDRDAMVAYESARPIPLNPAYAERVKQGEADDDSRVQAFARHRLAERAAVVAWHRRECSRYHQLQVEEANSGTAEEGYFRFLGTKSAFHREIADAIEQGRHHEGLIERIERATETPLDADCPVACDGGRFYSSAADSWFPCPHHGPLQQPEERDAEIARLREALEEIADADQSGGPNPYEIARTALGDGR